MKFGQLIEYNMGNIFLKNQTQNVVYKVFLDFSKKSSLGTSLDQGLNFYAVCFYLI